MLSFLLEIIMAKKDTSSETQIAVIAEKVTNIEEKVDNITRKLESNYITRDEFNTKLAQIEGKYDPGLKIVYGIVSLILTGVVGALLMLVLRK
jgi:hypothetical protein